MLRHIIKRRHPFATTPQLFLTIQDDAGGPTLVLRARDVTTTGFQGLLQAEEATAVPGQVIRVGYLAITAAGGEGAAPFAYSLDQITLDHHWATVADAELRLQEEQSADAEVVHPQETLALLTIASQPFLQDVSSASLDPHGPRRRSSATVERVSLSADGGELTGGGTLFGGGTANIGQSRAARISGDGRFVVYHSDATNYSPDDDGADRTIHVYLHDRQTGETQRISETADGIRGSADSGYPAISADGRYVAYWSRASTWGRIQRARKILTACSCSIVRPAKPRTFPPAVPIYGAVREREMAPS